MPPMRVLSPVVSCLLLGLAGSAAAQRTWIVDQFGTGDFLDVPPAVAAAAPGDSILVRGVGPYDFSVTIDKALALMGQVHGRFARGTLVIRGLPAGHTVTVKNFGHFDGDALRCEVRDCAGHVVLRRVTLDGRDGTGSRAGLSVVGSRAVAVDDVFVQGNPAGLVRASNLVGQGTFTAHAATLAGGAPLHGLDIEASSVALTASCRGGDGSMSQPRGGDGLRAIGSRLRLTGCAATAGQSHTGPAAYALFVGAGDVELNADPALTNHFAGLVETSTSTVHHRAFPIVGTGGWTQFNPLVVATQGLPGSLVGVFAGIPTAPFAIPEGDLWLLPAPLVVVHVGAIPTGGLLRLTLPLPTNLPWGLTFGLQAAAVTLHGFVLSPPAFPIFEPGAV